MNTANENIYAPPAATVEEVEPSVTPDTLPFYVVSVPKFFALFLATFGIYHVVWFYLHWRRYKHAHQADIWPVPRAIFAVFFTHGLLRAVDRQARRGDLRPGWNPSSLATAIVLSIIALNILPRLAGDYMGPIWQIGCTLALLGLVGHFSAQAQRVINRVCGDPEGRSNARFTLLNIVWLVLGGLLWLMALVVVLLG